MNKLSILVVLYNKQVKDSVTLDTLASVFELIDLGTTKVTLTIWNNGPTEVKPDYVIKNIDVQYKESLHNESLSVLYNKFIGLSSSQYYLILDDDSTLNKDYFQAVLNLETEKLAVPVIRSGGDVVSPTSMLALSKEVGRNFRAIGSGLVISSELIAAVKDKFKDVFDERFYFYGVDTSFIYRVNKLNVAPKIISGFDHSVSEKIIENKAREDFKRSELSYSLALKFRNYPSLYLLKFLIRVLFFPPFIEKKYSIQKIVLALITNKHPRNK